MGVIVLLVLQLQLLPPRGPTITHHNAILALPHNERACHCNMNMRAVGPRDTSRERVTDSSHFLPLLSCLFFSSPLSLVSLDSDRRLVICSQIQECETLCTAKFVESRAHDRCGVIIATGLSSGTRAVIILHRTADTSASLFIWHPAERRTSEIIGVRLSTIHRVDA